MSLFETVHSKGEGPGLHASVIGVGDYVHGDRSQLKQLSSPIACAHAMAEWLPKTRSLPSAELHTLQVLVSEAPIETECVQFDYRNGVVNGERALQACFYHRLTDQFKAEGMADRRRIFIEPTIYATGRTWWRMPDMMICDTRNVIAVMELKFHPRATLSGQLGHALRDGAEKDLDTLLGVAQDLNDVSANATFASHIEVSNERYLGVNGVIRTYGLADNLLLVWAGIYKTSGGDMQLRPSALHAFLKMLVSRFKAGCSNCTHKLRQKRILCLLTGILAGKNIRC